MKAFVATYTIGYLLFASQAYFDIPVWVHAWAVWDKLCMVLILYATINAKKGDAKILNPIFWLAGSRLVWELISWATGLNINHPKGVGLLFILFSIYVLYKLVKDARN